MNLSLYKLRKQIKRYKSGQGSLVAIVLASVIGTILISSATSWYLSMRKGVGNIEDKLEAQTIAQSEWERLSHMSLDELEAKREEFAEPYSAGTDSQYQISVKLGEKGTFYEGTCGDIGSDGYANCFKNTTITVYRDGDRMFTTRTLPLMTEDYNRGEFVGTIIPRMSDNFASEYEASRYLLCDGSTFDTTKYKKLYQVLGTNRLPDLQGVFLRGYGTQGNYTSGQLGQVQGDAMRKIHGDIPNVMIGDSLFGSYDWDMISFAGSPSLSASWNSHKITNRSYGTMVVKIPIHEYELRGSCNSGAEGACNCNYSLHDLNQGRVIGLEGNSYRNREFSDYGHAVVNRGLGNLAFVYRTVNIDSSKIVPTDKETRPANIAVKYYIRAK